MKISSMFRVLYVAAVCLALSWAPQSVFAQRGGHGGGGGFHGGASGFHGGGFASGGARSSGSYRSGGYYGSRGGYSGGYRGGYSGSRGRYYGGFRNGGYSRWRGGYYGRRGGYWGYPGYGYGWGFGFGWGSYWPYYGYPYGYSPWWSTPYYYPYTDPYGYSYPDDGNNGPPPADPGPKSRDNSPVEPPNKLAPSPYHDQNFGNSYPVDASRQTLPRNYGVAHLSKRPSPPPRQEVRDAIRAMRDMPPSAFQRRIDSGRYSNFTAEDREFVNNASEFPLVWEKPSKSASTARPQV